MVKAFFEYQPQNQTIMQEMYAKAADLCSQMLADMEKNVNGNKAAGARARKASLELEKLMKEYRKASVKA